MISSVGSISLFLISTYKKRVLFFGEDILEHHCTTSFSEFSQIEWHCFNSPLYPGERKKRHKQESQYLLVSIELRANSIMLYLLVPPASDGEGKGQNNSTYQAVLLTFFVISLLPEMLCCE